MKPWRLTPAAAQSLEDIAAWTIERFGDRQADAYCETLITRLNTIAEGGPPRPRPCSALLATSHSKVDLTYVREGGHFIILRETHDRIDVIEFLHGRLDLPHKLEALTKKQA